MVVFVAHAIYKTTRNRIVARIACDRNKFLFLFYTFISSRSRIFVISNCIICWPALYNVRAGSRASSSECRWIDTSICSLAAQFQASRIFSLIPSRHLAIRSPLAMNASSGIMAWIFPKVNRSCGYLIRKEDRNMRLRKNWKDTALRARGWLSPKIWSFKFFVCKEDRIIIFKNIYQIFLNLDK